MPVDNRTILQEFMDLRFNKRDANAAYEYVDKSFVGHSPRLGTTTRDDMLRDFPRFHQAFPDMRVTAFAPTL